MINIMEQKIAKVQGDKELAEAKAQANAAEVKRINESIERNKKLDNLLKPLSKDKANVMKQLLESTPTDRLEAAFKKYLTPVMEGKVAPTEKTVIAESKSTVTGDRSTKTDPVSSNNIIEIRRLAGLNN